MSVLGEADGMKESDTFHFLLSWPAARGGPSFLAVGLSLLLLGSCQTPPSNEGAARPVTRVRSAEKFAAQTVRYVIRSEQSDVRFLVYRAGALARLGHSHVVQAGTIKGEIHLAPDIRQSSFSLVLPIADFKVDAAESRAEEGEEFSVLPDDEAIAGTTKNMLGEKVLDAVSFPQIEIGSLALSGPAWGVLFGISVGFRHYALECIGRRDSGCEYGAGSHAPGGKEGLKSSLGNRRSFSGQSDLQRARGIAGTARRPGRQTIRS